MIKEGYTREVIPVTARYSDNTETPVRKEIYASKKTMITAALIPVSVSVPLIYKRMTETYTTTTIPVTANATAPIIAPPPSVPITPTHEALVTTPFPTGQPEVLAQPTGIVADTSLEILANILDPLITLMVAVSFPIASVIMVGSCFFFMFGNNERAWDGIFKASVGYILIQLSPMFLEILRQVGEAV